VSTGWTWREHFEEAVSPAGDCYLVDRWARPTDVKRLVRGEVLLLEQDDEHVLTVSPRARRMVEARCVQRGSDLATDPDTGALGKLWVLVNLKDPRDVVIMVDWMCW
jgi:hypothetical protein